MGHIILKLADDKFVEWSTVVDAPISPVFTKAEARQLYDPIRIQRADANGHSMLDYPPGTTAANWINCNRAGEKERRISVEKIIELYTDPDEVHHIFKAAEIRKKIMAEMEREAHGPRNR